MTITAILTFLPILFGMTAVAASGDEPRVRTMLVQDETVMRIRVDPQARELDWIERKGPKCIPAGAIRGAFLSGSDSVDFVTVSRRRFRAELAQDCPALDYYEGFYLRPEDWRVCAQRDVIRSRMGGSCRIEKFTQLLARPGE